MAVVVEMVTIVAIVMIVPVRTIIAIVVVAPARAIVVAVPVGRITTVVNNRANRNSAYNGGAADLKDTMPSLREPRSPARPPVHRPC